MSWQAYNEKSKALAPRALLVEALRVIEDHGDSDSKVAIDLGCGSGRDTRELLRRGWSVLAIDGDEKSLEILHQELKSNDDLQTRCEAFENLENLPSADLVYSSVAIPFCSKPAFPKFWDQLVSAVKPKAWIAADFFGPNDDWVKSGQVLGHTQLEIQALLRDFVILKSFETLKKEAAFSGEEKQWHILSVVARKTI